MNQIRQIVLTLLDVAQDAYGAIDSLPVPVVHFHLAPQRSHDWDAYGATSQRELIIGVESTLTTARCHRCGRTIDAFYGYDRRWRSGNPARPNIARFTIFSLLLSPSTRPVLHVCSVGAVNTLGSLLAGWAETTGCDGAKFDGHLVSISI